jgi:diguanylate cyclase (GGDEF)-like protein
MAKLRIKSAIGRLSLAAGASLLAHPAHSLLSQTAIARELDLWSLASFVSGLFLGPAGVVGSALAYAGTHLELVGGSQGAMGLIMLTAARTMPGVAAYLAFRYLPGARRNLADLASYLAFAAATCAGALLLGIIGMRQLFPSAALGSPMFWRGVAIWFSSAAATLFITGPLVVLFICRLPLEWRKRLGIHHSEQPAQRVGAGMEPRDKLLLPLMIVAVTLIVVPILRLGAELDSWLLLLYLVPILWASIRNGIQVALVTASASGLAYLFGTELWSALDPVDAQHSPILSAYAELVALALIGAFTGTLQTARLAAEKRLRTSKLELEARSDAMQVVSRLADRLHRNLDERAIAEGTITTLAQLSDVPMVGFFLLSGSSDQLELCAQQGFNEDVVRLGSPLPITGSAAGKGLRERQVLVVNDLMTRPGTLPDLREALRSDGVASMVTIPMVFEDVPLGSICLAYRERRQLPLQDLGTLRAIGHTVALALVNARRLSDLDHQAHHDSLTGLPNRARLHLDFPRVLADEPGGIGLALLDLDRFKEVNDALGHRAGDELLRKLGRRLPLTGASAKARPYRLGGDEFSLILPGVSGPAEAKNRVSEVLETLEMPFRFEGLTLEVSASAGIAIYPDHGKDSHELLRAADVALYQAKGAEASVSLYQEDYDQYTPDRLKLASELRDAIEDGQLILHYQPKIDLHRDRTIGFEALVRWQHPSRGLLPPSEFIPLAEVGNLIHPLTDWVLETALGQVAEWATTHPGLRIAVNLSTRSLLDATLPERIERIIADTGIHPEMVELELTETALLTDLVTSAKTIRALIRLGVGIAIDDFGTGYSSLTLLRELSVQALKVDRRFVLDLPRNEQSRAIVQATVQLARNLGIVAVAEGVEDRRTRDLLVSMGCEQAQGFFIARPAPADEVETWLTGRSEWGSLIQYGRAG